MPYITQPPSLSAKHQKNSIPKKGLTYGKRYFSVLVDSTNTRQL